MTIKLTDIVGYGPAGEGCTYVAYKHKFDMLTCDHYTRGTVAIDLFDANGKMIDGMTCCERCVDGGMELWHEDEKTTVNEIANPADDEIENDSYLVDADAAERQELAGETDEETALRKFFTTPPTTPRFTFRPKRDKTIPMPNFSDTDR